MRRPINAAALLLAMLLPACNGGPSYWITGTEEGATLVVPPGRFTPGFTVSNIKEVIRVPNNRDMASLVEGRAMQPEPEPEKPAPVPE